MNLLKNIDLFGSSINFYSNGKNSFNTKFGGLVTVLILLLIIFLVIAFGQDFYKRTNPITIRETEITKDYPRNKFTNKNFSVAVRLEDDSGNKLADNEFFKLTAYYNTYEIKDGFWTGNYTEIDLVPCVADLFYTKEEFDAKGIANYLCPIFNNTSLGGSWSSHVVEYFHFEAYICAKGKLDDNDELCKTQVEYEDINKESIDSYPYLSVWYQRSLVTPSNYTNGLQYAFRNEYFKLDKKLLKTERYFFKETKLTSDYGWILKDKSSISIFGYDYKDSHFTLNNPESKYISVGQMAFYFEKDIDKYSREYMKIQTLAANVGGIIKLFFVLAQLITMFYSNLEYLFQISKTITIKSISSSKNEHTMFKNSVKKNNNNINFNNFVKSSCINVNKNINIEDNSKKHIVDNSDNKLNAKTISEGNPSTLNNININKEHNEQLNKNNNNDRLKEVGIYNNLSNNTIGINFIKNISNNLIKYESSNVHEDSLKYNINKLNKIEYPNPAKYLLYKVLGCDSYKKINNELSHLIEETKDNLDISILLNRITFHEKIISILFTDNQIKRIKYELFDN